MSKTAQTKIFINGIAARRGGGVIYLNNLLKHLLKYKHLKIVIFGFSSINSELLNQKKLKVFNLPFIYRNIFWRIIIEQLLFPIIIWIGKFDVAFFPSGIVANFLPSYTRIIVVFQNALPFNKQFIDKLPFGYAKIRYKLLKRAYLRSFRIADHIIFLSSYSYNIVSNMLNNIKIHYSIIPHGINKLFRQRRIVNPLNPLLYVSTFSNYKHQIEIVKGLGIYRKLYGRAPVLRLVGHINKRYIKKLKDVICRSGVEDFVEILGPVPNKELPLLYRKSGWIIFASTCENCPIILLEAMGSNSPIICSCYQPMPEFLSDAGIYFDPQNINSFVKALRFAMEESAKKVQMRADYTYDIALSYSWSVTAKKTLKVLTG